MKPYYTDNEIIDSIDSKEIAEVVRERFEQKEQRISYLVDRVDVAAKYIGHQMITDLVEEEQY
jgi:hypothetical protein